MEALLGFLFISFITGFLLSFLFPVDNSKKKKSNSKPKRPEYKVNHTSEALKRAEEIVKEGKKEIENRNMLKKDEVMIDKVEKKNQKDLIDIDNYQVDICRKVHGFFHFYFTSSFCYIGDMHLNQHIKNENIVNIDKYISDVIKSLFNSGIRDRKYRIKSYIFTGDIASDFEISKKFYTNFMLELKEMSREDFDKKSVYLVLGNHEYWGFNNIDDCYSAYQELCDRIGIVFLNNTLHSFEKRRVANGEGYREYETFIIGSTGFAGLNNEFNASKGLYSRVINREEEIRLTEDWVKFYKEIREKVKEQGNKLIIVTHNPVSDWCADDDLGTSCVYINGHTHRNYFYKDEDKDLYVLADNQIGYKSNKIAFKIANFYSAVNPYVNMKNGCKETNIEEYLSFNDYIGEKLSGIGNIKKAIEKGDRLYVVKHEGYYAFFLWARENIRICVGGKVKKLNRKKQCTMWTIYKDFSKIIDIYLSKLSSFRKAQEEISEFVKSIGGSGKIHGCIVDIDFYNHIMLNPQDASITYYYSPEYGLVQPYETIYGLLKEHNEYMLDKYLALLDNPKECALIPTRELKEEHPKVQEIDIKNSVYAISNRMNQLQRLFETKVLREWNDDLLHKMDEVEIKLLENEIE